MSLIVIGAVLALVLGVVLWWALKAGGKADKGAQGGQLGEDAETVFAVVMADNAMNGH